ncbi:hypothetical protein Gasu2_01290 [Galdieria sulphuraria]|uniref:Zinc finger (C3HC4-type RING finger) family protein n=1 Tax=Galdieria sulphuraria TaxID=130081 RepID=M2WT87_GALSU|nr:zinc finger (C3HC4-type RING finger) family protein [Galdieria sulphuraria]EME27115.1 zinc finger (C3HC4-type RING finger) family protein [Galdieria sulphuraria]GJD05673.1 hypothetical protein Gasu2_01290 [Galdieria sulphuraria]|eukprot:XP_005703635.1 zinc finger (C3HC4-type RING finger) family protein [Galdieria sulphuraria]
MNYSYFSQEERQQDSWNLGLGAGFLRDMGEEYTCPVCYQDFYEELDIAKAPFCDHIFCITCILRWASIRASCPLCKASFDFLFVGKKQKNASVSNMGWEKKSLQVLFDEFSSILVPFLTEEEGNIQSSVVLRALLEEDSRERWNGEDDWFSCELDQLEEAIDHELWEEEAMLWSKTSKSMQRQCGNRPFGASGYIKNERLRAKACSSYSEGASSSRGSHTYSKWRSRKRTS